MNGSHQALLFRRFAASLVDLSLELGGGLMGSYFGAMVAALVMTLKNDSAQAMQTSIWNGFGFGFAFWTLSISFLNRVLIQGLSRASIGKKIFKLEMIAVHHPLDWPMVAKRWVLSMISLALGGLGYTYMFFDKEGRSIPDLLTDTDVVPLFQGRNMSVEHDERHFVATQVMSPSFTEQLASRLLVLSHTHAERPTATVIQLPLRERIAEKTAEKFAEVITLPNLPSPAASTRPAEVTLAQVIELRPADESAVQADDVKIITKKVA